MTTKGVFYFEFAFEFEDGEPVDIPEGDDPEMITKGFVYDFGNKYQEAIDSGVLDVDDRGGTVYTEFSEDGIIGHGEEMEEAYGVHNWFTSPHPDVIGVGYGSYEVHKAKVDEFMKKWQEIFCDMTEIVGVIKEITDTSFNPMDADDNDFYEALK